jgi:hypothetical protein
MGKNEKESVEVPSTATSDRTVRPFEEIGIKAIDQDADAAT